MTIGILDLPNEILMNISNHLSYPSILAMRWACHALYDILRQVEVYEMADLLEIELWPLYNAAKDRPQNLKQAFPTCDFFACHLCLKIKRAEGFSNAMMKGKRGKLASGSFVNRVARFCISCGVSTGRYQPGVQFDYGGAGLSHGVVCRGCGKFNQFKGISRLGLCYSCLSRNKLIGRESQIDKDASDAVSASMINSPRRQIKRRA
ncbi:hypothetical protein TWF506_003065 [Arthrobotrys conoides]|uniref:F-box domain-containing protein n=1 Tax=Arthrobotrys conoides TaxID=74498 RepID=A0AAN8RKT2_9PEZI